MINKYVTDKKANNVVRAVVIIRKIALGLKIFPIELFRGDMITLEFWVVRLVKP